MSRTTPDLSIIIPVFHAESFLPDCLDSVTNIKGVSFEAIVIDDGSIPDCKKIVAEYQDTDSRIRYVRHPSNRGLFEARYTGISHAKGTFIAHLDPDDQVDRHIYSMALVRAEETNADVVLFNVEQCDEQGNRWTDSTNSLTEFKDWSGLDILNRIFDSHSNAWIWHVSWNKLIRKEVATQLLSLFEKRHHLVMYEDILWSIALFLQIGKNKTCASISHCGLLYFRHSDSATLKATEQANSKRLTDTLNMLLGVKRLLKRFGLYKRFREPFIKTELNLLKRFDNRISHAFRFTHPIKYLKFRFIFLRHHRIYGYFLREKNLEIIEAANKIASKVACQEVSNVCIYGTGELGRILFQRLTSNGLTVDAFVLTSIVGTSRICNIPVISISDAMKRGCDRFVVASLGSADAIRAVIRSHEKRMNVRIHPYGLFRENGDLE